MAEQQDITETTDPIDADGLGDAAPVEDLAGDAPVGDEGDPVAEAGESSVEDEAPEFFDLNDADLDSLPAFKRKVGDEEKIYKVKELLEHYERFGTLKQVQDVQSLYRKLEQERPQIEQKAKAEFESYKAQITPVIQQVQAYEQRLATDPGGVALEILKSIVPPQLYQNIEQALHTPQHEGGAGYNPQAYRTQYQAQQAPQVQQQLIEMQAAVYGRDTLQAVIAQSGVQVDQQTYPQVQQRAAVLWEMAKRDPSRTGPVDAATIAKQAIEECKALGIVKAPKPASLPARQSLNQQIQKVMQKPKTGVRQVGTGGAPPRQSRALELAAKMGGE